MTQIDVIGTPCVLTDARRLTAMLEERWLDAAGGDDDAGFGDSSEYGVGMNWYPYPTRNHRLNVQLLDVNKSPVSSTFGYYTGGQDGWTPASSFSIFF